MAELSYIRDLQTGETLRFDYFADDSDISDSVTVEWGETAIIGRSEPFRHYGGTSKRTLSVSLIFCGSVTQEDRMIAEKFVNFDEFGSNSSSFEFRRALDVRNTKLADAIRVKNESILISSGAMNGPNFSPNAIRRADNSISNIASVDVNDAVPLAWRVVHQVNFLRSFLYPTYVGTPDGRNVARVDKPPLAFISLATFLKFKGIVTEVNPTWKKPFISSELSLPILAEVSLTFDVISDTPYDSRGVRQGYMGTVSGVAQSNNSGRSVESLVNSKKKPTPAYKNASSSTSGKLPLPAPFPTAAQWRAGLQSGTIKKRSPVVRANLGY
jgi:hypothetical protein